ncbi:hypothetical protein SLEP1_g30356 [Rubroshorea leprosula]|uniref:Uncharacterized protein n=1 Tax=Rubroshorea leprosula TaxID=152421 RepID=A0AAV5JZS1_9ROSI|nr:hypothetical protein SLEP1_g30356 [Rubroshorea leprosula]
MLEPLGSPAAQACWSRHVLPTPMTLRGYSVSSDDPSGSIGFWVLFCFFVSDLATLGFLVDIGRCSLLFQFWPPSDWISAAAS